MQKAEDKHRATDKQRMDAENNIKTLNGRFKQVENEQKVVSHPDTL
jgi:hypothetical protein